MSATPRQRLSAQRDKNVDCSTTTGLERPKSRNPEGMSICGSDHRVDAQGVRGTRLVFDNDRFAEYSTKRIGYQPRQRIRRCAWWITDDDVYALCRPPGVPRGACGRTHQQAEKGGGNTPVIRAE